MSSSSSDPKHRPHPLSGHVGFAFNVPQEIDQTSSNQALSPNWVSCVKAVRDYDEAVLLNWHRGLDTLLVFASLFSAVVTAFLIESSKLLGPDEANPPKSHSVTINAFWYCSLVLAMNTVLVTILVKQWLTEYVWDVGTFVPSPRQGFALRHLRFQLLSQWKVPTIIECLPLQLVIALLLFYVGLISFLWILHPIVAALATSLIAISVLIFVLTTIAPVWQPLCPFQSPQAWFFYRISHSVSRWFFPEARSRLTMPRDGDWVDHGIEIIRSHDDALYETKGLIWVQRSLGTWNPGLIKQVFSCAVSLSGTAAPQVLCVLCADYVPISVLRSEDAECGLQLVNNLGELLESSVFLHVYSTIHTYLSTFKDSEAPFKIQDPPEFEPGIWLLLGLVRHQWVDSSRAKVGWDLLLELSTSSTLASTPSLQTAVRKRIFQTFLEDGLLVRDTSVEASPRNETSDIEIKLPESWPLTALTPGVEFEEEHMWILLMAFTLFVLLKATCNQQASKCCRLLTSYLDGKLRSKDHCQNMTRAVQLLTRILLRREKSLDHSGDGAANQEFHDNPRSLLRPLSAAVTAAPSLEGLKDDVWNLRMLAAQTVQDIHECFDENPKILRDYQMDPKSTRTRSPVRDLTDGRSKALVALMMKKFPSSPWQNTVLDYNHHHVLITAFILNATVGRDYCYGSSPLHEIRARAFPSFFQLLADGERTIFVLDDERLSSIETAFVHTFRAIAKDYSRGRDHPFDVPQKTILDVLTRECTRGRVNIVLSLTALLFSRLRYSRWSAYTEILNVTTTFLEAEGTIRADMQPKGWIKLTLRGIKKGLKLTDSQVVESETWETLQRFLELMRDNCGHDLWDEERKELLEKVFHKVSRLQLNISKSAHTIPLRVGYVSF
ncbi:hypothetical protein EST38_g5607 [Candolleomyces aberdarensis]|uniref:DUF6535 domain-containing protein n=1 Tax=Candolleomyces aberdarensis TaxID=2316362 RepID=A0A4Q2DK51_9AGAR|nr:hypothetical protein EST38_g5607 [Candolleomyces aberdarensis]